MPDKRCGTCCFAVDEERGESLWCMVNPPVIIAYDDGVSSARAVEVEPNDPPCRHWQPKLAS